MLRKGFVDLQVNGFLGVDFSAPGLQLNAVRSVVRELVRRGTVAFCPTVITAPQVVYKENLPVLARAFREDDLAPHLLGIHLEGPFLSPHEGARGAHCADFMTPPTMEAFERLQSLAEGRVRLMTVAPELDGAIQFIATLKERGVVTSLGHHLADRRTVHEARRAGAAASTHLGNGIPNQLPRHPNPIWSQLDEEELVAMVIVDGHHVPDEFVRVTLTAKGVGRFIVVSDATPIAGCPPGRYQTLGQEVVLEESGRAWNPAGNHLVGSTATMLQCMQRLADITQLSEIDLWRVGFENPLKLVGCTLDKAVLGHLPEIRLRRPQAEPD